MSKPDSEDAKERRDEIRELLERCRSMERELTQIKEKVAKIQKGVDRRLRRKNSGVHRCAEIRLS
jgi:hypothetical protein